VTRFRTDYCDNQIRAVLKRMGGGEPGRGLSAERVAAGVADGSPDESARGASTLGQMKGDARHLLLAGETSSARRLLLKALQTDADDPDVRTLLAVLHCQAGQYDNAVYMMEQLVSERDAGAVAHLVLGGAYLALGRVSDSERHVRRAIEIDPASGEAHYDMAQVLVARDPPDAAGARRHYGLALKLGGTADASLEGRMGTPTAPANGPEREGPAPRLPTAREGAASRE
jgi:Tfp pilus assembly protein PilF